MSVRRTITCLRRTRRWPWAVPVLMLALVPLISNIGGASIPDGAGQIHACYGDDGQLRVIDTAGVTGTCKALETQLSWNQSGPTDLLLGFNAVANGTDATTNSTTFVSVPGASAPIVVPPGQTATVVAVFTAESLCTGASGWCSVRILVDGVEASPAVGSTFAFDSNDDGTVTTASWESHSITRFATGIGAGTHTVTVERWVSAASVNFRLDDFTLVVQAMKT